MSVDEWPRTYGPYTVHVTYEDGWLLADVPELPGTHTDSAFSRLRTAGQNARVLDRYVRETIVLGADLPNNADQDIRLVWNFDRFSSGNESRDRRFSNALEGL